jgi:tRNA(Ser,Leu) C12 N-acetylase TAN1
MRLHLTNKVLGAFLVCAIIGFAPFGRAQDKPADNMQILREKLRADKKLVVASNMDLTETEAKGFWPIYDQYQKDLDKINQRIAKLLDSYADDFRKKSITDERRKS